MIPPYPDTEYTTSGIRKTWLTAADGRIEIVNRIKLWRFLTGDENFDCAYWLTRVVPTRECFCAGLHRNDTVVVMEKGSFK